MNQLKRKYSEQDESRNVYPSRNFDVATATAGVVFNYSVSIEAHYSSTLPLYFWGRNFRCVQLFRF